MKTKIYFIIASLLTLQLSTAQVLFTENFNNLAVGEVSTDPTGTTPGKGGWYVKKTSTPYTFTVAITPETGRGNVLVIGSNTNNTNGNGNGAVLTQKNINTLWNNRMFGNNVFKLEYDIYLIGSNQYRIESVVGLINDITGRGLLQIVMGNNAIIPSTTQAVIGATYYDTASTPYYKNLYLGANNTSRYDNFPYNSWLSVELFIDYKYEVGIIKGGKIYIYIPILNILKTADFTHSETIDLLNIRGFGSGNLTVAVKYDNIKITALQTMPSYILSVEEVLGNKFNLYPNPATNVVNITNAENLVVEKITVYDIASKEINTQTFNNQAEIQLNIENLENGTYMLHLQTNQGTAVKKLIKK